MISRGADERRARVAPGRGRPPAGVEDEVVLIGVAARRLRDRLPRPSAALALDQLPEESAAAVAGPIPVVLVDAALCGGPGLPELARFASRHPRLPVLVVGVEAASPTLATIRAGAQGRVDPDCAPEPLAARIAEAAERQRRFEELRERSLHDPLTGLHNRRGFLELVDHHLRLAQRSPDGLALVYADVDGLKEINDRYGHTAGDEVLVEVARCLRGTFRDSDVLGRLGGDEFAVLAVGAGPGELEAAIVRLTALLAQARPGPEWRIRLSVGTALADGARGPGAVGSLLATADSEMYRAKRQSRRIAVPGPSDGPALLPLLRALCAHPRTSPRARGLLGCVLDALEGRLGREESRTHSLGIWLLRQLRHELPRQLFVAADDDDPDAGAVLARALRRLAPPLPA